MLLLLVEIAADGTRRLSHLANRLAGTLVVLIARSDLHTARATAACRSDRALHRRWDRAGLSVCNRSIKLQPTCLVILNSLIILRVQTIRVIEFHPLLCIKKLLCITFTTFENLSGISTLFKMKRISPICLSWEFITLH